MRAPLSVAGQGVLHEAGSGAARGRALRGRARARRLRRDHRRRPAPRRLRPAAAAHQRRTSCRRRRSSGISTCGATARCRTPASAWASSAWSAGSAASSTCARRFRIRACSTGCIHDCPPFMKIGLVSLGCPKNLVDSEVMLGLAQQAPVTRSRADAADADVLVVNTCAFIDPAKQESIDAILEMAQHKTDGTLPAAGRHRLPRRTLSRRACGRDPGDRRRARHGRESPRHRRRHRRCGGRGHSGQPVPASEAAEAGRDFAAVDPGSPAPAASRPGGPAPRRAPPTARCRPISTTPRRRASLTTPRHYAYVKIAEGCDYNCAFCIIPTLRGPVPQPSGRVDRRGGPRARRPRRQGAAADLAGFDASTASTARSAARWRGCCASWTRSTVWSGSGCSTSIRRPSPTTCSTRWPSVAQGLPLHRPAAPAQRPDAS